MSTEHRNQRPGHAVVLGHSGFLGRPLVQRLSQAGWDVAGHSSATLDLRQRDAFAVLEPEWTEDSVLVVAAALTPDRGQTLDQLQDNLTMALNVARFVQDHLAGLVVYVSSDAVYPFGTDAVTEESAVEPAGAYAFAKYAGERIIGDVARARDVPFLLVRPTAVYGPGDTHNSYGPNRFIRSIARDGVVQLFGEGEETRDHLYVDDAVELIVRLMGAKTTGTYNLATGTSKSFGEVLEALRGVVPKPFQVENLPRRSGVTHRRFDTTRLHEAIGPHAFVPLDQGLRSTHQAATVAAQ